jgi:hypothetical protein
MGGLPMNQPNSEMIWTPMPSTCRGAQRLAYRRTGMGYRDKRLGGVQPTTFCSATRHASP